MKSKITIEYHDGSVAQHQLIPGDYARWEKETGKSMRSADQIGLWDFLFLAYQAHRRSKPNNVQPFEIWMDTVKDLDAEEPNPKATAPEASTDS